ncbi:MAG: hypothetical protein IH840_06105 [Candidatus Heimdallarchaeota archaeon]|nr:hypothetical protein [Candidatus Heimdallarchaeota archaeon]
MKSHVFFDVEINPIFIRAILSRFMNAGEGLTHVDDMYDINPAEHKQSIKKLLNYSFTTALFGHGDQVLENASQLLGKLLKALDL